MHRLLLKYNLAMACILCMAVAATAQQFSYIYIQGDKQTPFYVKREGKMQPRYAKNYSIISELTAGPAHLEILFQQRMFPLRKFTLIVPEHCFRGFLLNKVATDSFSLYDLQAKRYLPLTDETITTGNNK